MTTNLDSILSGQGEAVSETNDQQEQVTQETQAEGEGQQQETEATTQETQQQGQKTVPHEALHAEKQKVKRYTEEVTSLRQEIADRDAAWERRIAQLLEAQKPKQEPAPRPDFFENPEAATQHLVQGQVSPQFEQINQTLQAFAKDNAITRFTEEAVNEAETAFISALQGGKLDQADYQKVVTSPNRYAAAVQWHKRQQAQAEIGDDPAAFKAKLEAEIREKVLAEMNGGTQQQAKAAPVMPSNLAGARNVGARSGPVWSGPASLQDIFNRG
jgi:hypothetical protein